MSNYDLAQEFKDHLIKRFPGLSAEPPSILNGLISQNLLSPFTIELPSSVHTQAKDIVSKLFSMAHEEKYKNYYAADLVALGVRDPGHHAIMMSYDFHIDPTGQLKLIEINTNAAFLILGYELYLVKGIPPAGSDFSEHSLKDCILNEINLFRKTGGNLKGLIDSESRPLKLAIVDQQPQLQRLYVEFLVAQELFRSYGFQTDILDSGDPEVGNYDFVYNRDTDFYLDQERTSGLRALYENRKICLSPNPWEYFLLADKQRLIDWSQSDWQNNLGLSEAQKTLLQKHIPQSFDLNQKSAEDIWSRRKGLFFKPKRAFGSKQSYKGSSISRKAFDAFSSTDIIAQEYVPAPVSREATPEGSQDFKFDLRCYAYMGKLQLILARAYQGQVTNLRTPYGGFCCVKFQEDRIQ